MYSHHDDKPDRNEPQVFRNRQKKWKAYENNTAPIIPVQTVKDIDTTTTVSAIPPHHYVFFIWVIWCDTERIPTSPHNNADLSDRRYCV